MVKVLKPASHAVKRRSGRCAGCGDGRALCGGAPGERGDVGRRGERRGDERCRDEQNRSRDCCCRGFAVAVAVAANFLSISLILCQTAAAQSILPPAPGAIGGGNPLQGLGRADDPSPSRYQDFAKQNLQDVPSTRSGGAFSSDLLNKSTLDNSDASLGESLNKLLAPDGLNSLSGFGTENSGGFGTGNAGGLSTGEGAGGEGSEASGGLRGGLKSNSPEFTDRGGGGLSAGLEGLGGETSSASQTTSEQSISSEALETGSGETAPRAGAYGSAKIQGERNSSISENALPGSGNEGLPPEPAGLAGLSAPLKAPSLATPIKTTDLSAPPKAEDSKKRASGSADAKASQSEHAATGGASEKDSRESAAITRLLQNPNASPMSKNVSDRIRQALQNQGRQLPQTPAKTAPEQFHLVPAPPPMAVAMPPAGPTPERQALGLMQRGNYGLAERQLRELVSTDQDNLHARYLFAVALVYNKKYDEAKTNYALIIRKAQDKKLVEMAEVGLRKLTH